MKILNYLILSVVTVIVATGISYSQTYSISPNDTFQITGTPEDLEVLTISQLNTTNDTLFLQWHKVSESVPVPWEASNCDNLHCYNLLEDSGSMGAILPNDSGYLLMHITSHVNTGMAVIRYAVWDMANPLLKDTLTYILTVNALSAIGESAIKSDFNISPNPVKDNFNIITNFKSGFAYSIIDLSGKIIMAAISNANTISVSTENMPMGNYILELKTNKQLFTQKLIKQ